MIRCIRKAATGTVVLLLFVLTVGLTNAASTATWPASSVIYTLYPSIFSPSGNFAGVTAQLRRLKSLGVTDIWIMPVTPVGQAIGDHPTVGSPYCVHDYYGINPDYGTSDDLHKLIARAHALRLRVLLDEVLNHTAWDNTLITEHPEYYVHTDGDLTNPATIREAFTYSDVAQLNYASSALRDYIIKMLQFWIEKYHVDGFRFDCANDPDGPTRMIPADFWQQLGDQLRAVKPDVLLLEEGESPDLAQKPFMLDYAWRMVGPLKDASNGGDASQIETTWQGQVADFPPGMQHMSIQDDWDYARDVNTFGGAAGALAVAAFDFTNTGVPLIYNGMEIGNSAGGSNPHAAIDWTSGDPKFTSFYKEIIALRRKNAAFEQGAMTWLTNSAPSQLLTYERAGCGSTFLVEINLSSTAVNGSVTTSDITGWTELPFDGIADSGSHVSPPQVILAPKEFAIFERSN